MNPVYSLRNLEKFHGLRPALQIEALDLYPARIYCLSGPNGAGKSTLLQLLAFLDPPCSGALSFRGQKADWRASSLKKYRRCVTLVHQSPYLFNSTVQQNVSYGLDIRGIRGQQQKPRIEKALALVGMSGYENRKATELSGGEARRVALARALALEPEVLLLDEPGSALEHEMIPVLEEVIKSCRDSGTTVILSTHDPEQPVRLGAELLRLDQGRLLDSPPPKHPCPEQTAVNFHNLNPFSLEVSRC